MKSMVVHEELHSALLIENSRGFVLKTKHDFFGELCLPISNPEMISKVSSGVLEAVLQSELGVL